LIALDDTKARGKLGLVPWDRAEKTLLGLL